MGKVEAGVAKKGQSLLLMPNRVSFYFIAKYYFLRSSVRMLTIYFLSQTIVVVDQFFCDDIEVNSVGPGENVRAKLKAIEEEDISQGFVLCDPNSPISVGRIFDAQVCFLVTIPSSGKL